MQNFTIISVVSHFAFIYFRGPNIALNKKVLSVSVRVRVGFRLKLVFMGW